MGVEPTNVNKVHRLGMVERMGPITPFNSFRVHFHQARVVEGKWGGGGGVATCTTPNFMSRVQAIHNFLLKIAKKALFNIPHICRLMLMCIFKNYISTLA